MGRCTLRPKSRTRGFGSRLKFKVEVVKDLHTRTRSLTLEDTESEGSTFSPLLTWVGGPDNTPTHHLRVEETYEPCTGPWTLVAPSSSTTSGVYRRGRYTLDPASCGGPSNPQRPQGPPTRVTSGPNVYCGSRTQENGWDKTGLTDRYPSRGWERLGVKGVTFTLTVDGMERPKTPTELRLPPISLTVYQLRVGHK